MHTHTHIYIYLKRQRAIKLIYHSYTLTHELTVALSFENFCHSKNAKTDIGKVEYAGVCVCVGRQLIFVIWHNILTPYMPVA